MPDEQQDDTTTSEAASQESEATTEETTAETTVEDTEAEAEGDGENGEDTTGLPEWAKKKLSKLNNEAAGWRTQLREAQAALEKAVSPEDFEAAKTDMATKINGLERELVAEKFKLPPELAELMKGNSREELETHAKTLQKFVPQSSDDDADLAGGLNPTDEADLEMNPRELARRARSRGRRF